ncbi:uncharacterized protein LOC131979983, partial [Centropristis striata]|uniref:uncharacterized protein LOC131979983 n=1 Tax=Centropristis striata TaxID=184440 RepID=UPI0027DF01A7
YGQAGECGRNSFSHAANTPTPVWIRSCFCLPARLSVNQETVTWSHLTWTLVIRQRFHLSPQQQGGYRSDRWSRTGPTGEQDQVHSATQTRIRLLQDHSKPHCCFCLTDAVSRCKNKDFSDLKLSVPPDWCKLHTEWSTSPALLTAAGRDCCRRTGPLLPVATTMQVLIPPAVSVLVSLLSLTLLLLLCVIRKKRSMEGTYRPSAEENKQTRSAAPEKPGLPLPLPKEERLI